MSSYRELETTKGRDDGGEKMIYVAHPYTTGNTELSPSEILEKVGLFAYSAHLQGHMLYHPVLMGENILRWSATNDLEENHKYEFWAKHNRWMIERADALWVFTIKGWESSEGVREELKYAVDHLGRNIGLITDIGDSYDVRETFFANIWEEVKCEESKEGGWELIANIEKAKV